MRSLKLPKGPDMRIFLFSSLVLSFLILPFAIASATPRQDWFYIFIGVESIDQDAELLTTRYFESAINIYKDERFEAHIFYRNPINRTDDSFNVSRFEQYSKQVWRYELSTLPERGSHPWVWPLARTGIFPYDRYSLHLLVALNATADFDSALTTINLPEDLRSKWNVSVEFQRFPAQPTPDDVKAMLLEYKRFNDTIRNRYKDFYRVTACFSRPDIDRYRFTFHSLVAWCLLLLVVVSSLLLITHNLKRDSVLQICLGIAFFAVPNLIWLQGYLPRSRLDLIELVFMVDILGAILLALFSILYEPLGHLCEWCRHRSKDAKRIR